MDTNTKNITINLPTVEDAEQSLSTLSPQLHTLVESSKTKLLSNITESFKINREAINLMGTALSNLTETMRAQAASFSIKPITAAIQQFSTTVSQFISQIHTPTISQERKQEMIDAHKQWGELGWTYFPDAPLGFYNKPPASVETANDTVMRFCSKAGMTRIFNDLRTRNIKKEDLEAAIYCYEHGQYKACSLILFGIIDSKMIRTQKRGEKRRKIGARAVGLLKGSFEKSQNEEALYIMLDYVNLFACLEAMFADGCDFKSEPSIINRNFVAHGMNRRSVRKRDCIQLFLVLDNLLYFLSYGRKDTP